MNTIPSIFIEKFVKKQIRDRVKHEWNKKPEKLHHRICHNADELFSKELKRPPVSFVPNENVYLLKGTNPKIVKYSEAEKHLDCGEGVLVVGVNGDKFIAETESSPGHPHETYSGT